MGDKSEVLRERWRFCIIHLLDGDMLLELQQSIQEHGLLYQLLIWDKGVKSTSPPVGERFLYASELVVVVFEKQGEGQKRMGICRALTKKERTAYSTLLRTPRVSENFKHKGQVVNHYQKPLALCMHLLLMSVGHLMEAPGDNTLHVLDITCGSGTTAVSSHSVLCFVLRRWGFAVSTR